MCLVLRLRGAGLLLYIALQGDGTWLLDNSALCPAIVHLLHPLHHFSFRAHLIANNGKPN